MRFECEKIEVCEDDSSYIKLVIYEMQPDGSSAVLDITHHNTEREADEWLADNWKMASPPAVGVRQEFENDAS